MKLEKKVAKLLQEEDSAVVIKEIIRQLEMPQVLLQISNIFVAKSGGIQDKPTSRLWLKRAKAVHAIMDEMIEENLNNIE